MNTKTFFTLSEYKQNYDKLRTEFVEAYEDNDEEEFLELQTEWYQRCLENTKIEHGILADGVGWDTAAMMTGENFVWEVDKKVRTKEGGINKDVASNLNISFKKILKFLKEKENPPKKNCGDELSAAQAMLYHYILQEANLEPEFPAGGKIKALETLSLRYGPSTNNLKKKYNVIRRGAKQGYNEEDALIVRKLIIRSHPNVLPLFQDMTKHILF